MFPGSLQPIFPGQVSCVVQLEKCSHVSQPGPAIPPVIKHPVISLLRLGLLNDTPLHYSTTPPCQGGIMQHNTVSQSD